MQNKFLLSAILATVTSFTALFAADGQKECIELNPEAYKEEAQKVVSSTLSLRQGLPIDLESFLEEKISSAASLKDNTLDVSKAFGRLNPSKVGLFVINDADCKCEARFYWEFVYAGNKLAAHRVRRILKCYTGALESFEASYAHEMQKVTIKEYKERQSTLDPFMYAELVIEEAGRLAHAIKAAKQLAGR